MGSIRDKVIDHKIPKTSQDYHQQNKQQNQVPLRCPRCDSINTKFCYYNNYSLSQPRHFCKACKRYWTRGGTLRNVPIGGGYRRNKRVRRSLTSSSSSSTSCSSTLDANDSVKNPLFYGLPTNHSTSFDMNFSFSRYDIQNPPQINGFGLGFSSSSCGYVESRHGFTGSKQSFQDLIFTNPLLCNYTTISANKSLLGSNNLQIKGQNSFQTLLPSYEDDDLHMKQVKTELQGQIKSMEHQELSQNYHVDQTMGLSSSDPSLLWVSGSGLDNLGSWIDPTNNIGSSITSLI